MSNKSSVQLHVTFDVGDKHGDIFTYVEIPRFFFNIFMITFGKILYGKKRIIYFIHTGLLFLFIQSKMLRYATPGDSIVLKTGTGSY